MKVPKSKLVCLLTLACTIALGWVVFISLDGDLRLPLKRSAIFTELCRPFSHAGDVSPTPNEVLSSAPVCTPQEHIMFLKTHKCASTTLQNLFFRYGVLRSLVIALPDSANYFGHPELFQANMVPQHLLSPNGAVDIFAVHSRLNVPQLLQVLHPHAAFVTVVRDPGSQFESIYGYYQLQSLTGYSLETFLKLPLEKQISYRQGYGRIGPNSMLFDLGVEFNLSSTAVEVQRAVQRIDETFDLVMIVEKMDESLILLKKLLCWEYDDILIFTRNSRMESSKVVLSDDELRQIQELNSGDVHLYNHFLAKHNEAVLQYGRDKMAKDVAFLLTLRQDTMQDCHKLSLGDTMGNSYWLKEHLKQGDIFTSYGSKRNLTCWMLLQKELPLIENIRNFQNSRV